MHKIALFLAKKLRVLVILAKYIAKYLDKACRYFLLFLIRGLRPFLGPAHCKHPISCTDYAEEKLRNRSLFPAVWLITKRVLSCNPFMNPKVD